MGLLVVYGIPAPNKKCPVRPKVISAPSHGLPLREFSTPDRHLVPGKSFRGTCLCLGSFLFAVLRWSTGFERMQKPAGDSGDLIDRRVKRVFVGFGGLVEPGDFANELQRRRAHLIFADGRVEVKQSPDIPAHLKTPENWMLQLRERSQQRSGSIKM